MTGPGPLDRPRALVDLVPVQPGAVVSRIVLKERSGNVTLFAFGHGEGLSEHTTPHEALAVVLDGEAEVVVGGEAHAVAGGEAVRLPAGVPHAVGARTDVRMMLVMLRRARE